MVVAETTGKWGGIGGGGSREQGGREGGWVFAA
jgi:hypothetical protein